MSRGRWITLVAALVVLVAGGLVAVRVLGGDEAEERAQRARSAGATFAEASALAPDDAQRVLWTDWAGVRDEVGSTLGASSSAEELDAMLDRAFDADLSSMSALTESAAALQESFGFSPATLEWELFTQSERAATLTLRLGGDVTTDAVAARLRALGYTEPSSPEGVWQGGDDLPSSGSVTPELSYVALDADAGLVLASDQPAGVTIAVDAADEADADPIPRSVVAGLGTPLAAAAYAADYACSALAMAGADPDEQAVGESLVEQAGQVNPLTGFGIGAAPGGSVRVTLGFEDEEQAGANAETRAVLVSGPAPGQGGDFADRFAVEQVSVDDTVVRFDLDPVDGAFVLSELSTGPVLFATC